MHTVMTATWHVLVQSSVSIAFDVTLTASTVRVIVFVKFHGAIIYLEAARFVIYFSSFCAYVTTTDSDKVQMNCRDSMHHHHDHKHHYQQA